jgi:tRNA A37 threonylcarbamoyladenosine dehydratase
MQPSWLGELLDKDIGHEPRIFDLSLPADLLAVEQLAKDKQVRFATDDFVEQLRELFAIQNPEIVYAPGFSDMFDKHLSSLKEQKPLEQYGRWVYYPWRGQLVHVLEEDDFFVVRTARNRNLITQEEQRRYYDARIGIAGLSVGSAVAFALTLQGASKHIKLADMDALALTNTNRVLAGADRLGQLKVKMASRTIFELNPYAVIEIFPEGLVEGNIEKFFEGLDIVVDEIDELSIKLRIREEARKRKIPVLMGADNGDNAIIDVERYDLNQAIEPFHGKLGAVRVEDLRGLDKFGIGKTITKMLGPENITERMQQSLLEMGKTIVSWPQLGGAALLNGIGIAYCARKIVIGEPLDTGRVLLSMDEKFVPGYGEAEKKARRDEVSRKFAATFGL